MNKIKVYQEQKQFHEEKHSKLVKQHNIVSVFRLISIALSVFLGYKFFITDELLFLVFSILSFASFVFLIKFHDRIFWKKNILKSLIKINSDESNYLTGAEIPFKDGSEYINTQHSYSYDLDFFGPRSLFHNLNRTSTYIGGKKLAKLLLTLLPLLSLLHPE